MTQCKELALLLKHCSVCATLLNSTQPLRLVTPVYWRAQQFACSPLLLQARRQGWPCKVQVPHLYATGEAAQHCSGQRGSGSQPWRCTTHSVMHQHLCREDVISSLVCIAVLEQAVNSACLQLDRVGSRIRLRPTRTRQPWS